MITRAIVIGASAGGVEALQEVVSKLPSDLSVPVFVVLHVPPYVVSSLPEILTRSGPLPALHPRDGEQIVPGRIYVAPPDHHMLIDGEYLAVKKGPKENRFRPSIDALFRSAAYVFREKAIGVILSGALDDGTSGLWSVKRLGGIAVVQCPSQARFESMPASALQFVKADHNVPSTEIGELLGQLVGQEFEAPSVLASDLVRRMDQETKIAAEGGAFQKGVMEFGTLTAFTCPECHGVLVRIPEGDMLRFRCHTGHAYTDSSLLQGVMESTGDMLWQVIRSFEEGAMLLSDMGHKLQSAGNSVRAEIFFAKAQQLEERSQTFHGAVLRHESLSGDNITSPAVASAKHI